MLSTKDLIACIRYFGISCQSWSPDFFESIVFVFGVFICVADDTSKHLKFDVARILIRTKFNDILEKSFNMEIQGINFKIKIVEESFGP